MAWRATVWKDTAIAGILGLGADLFCQCVCEKKDWKSGEVDKQRALAIAIFSGSYLGVACNYIYSLYPALAKSVMKSSSFQRILLSLPSLTKVRLCESKTQGAICTMADNLIHVPVLYLPTYFFAVGTMQGIPITTIGKDMQESWWSTLGSCWAFWIPFMALNFTAVPPAQRVRAVAGANFCWTVTLDYLTQKKH